MAAILEFEKEQTTSETRFTPSEVDIICRLLTDSSNRLEEKVSFLVKRQRNRTRFYRASPFLLLTVILISFRWRDYLSVILPILFGIIGGFTTSGLVGSKFDIETESIGLSDKVRRYLQIASQVEEHGRISRMQKMELDFRMFEAEQVLRDAARHIGKTTI